MHIHQMSVTYQPEQDRILVRINTREGDEMRLWLTRRLMTGLWPMLSKMFTDHLLKLEAAGTSLKAADESLRKMLTDFRKEEFLREADFDTPYEATQQPKLPLGSRPLLVTDVDATPQDKGPLRLGFNERPPNGKNPRSFQIDLQPKLMQGLMHLLEQALAKSQWREPFAGAPATEETGAAADKGDKRPRYLN